MAQSNAERQQRHRERLKNRVLQLEARIRELEQENAALAESLRKERLIAQPGKTLHSGAAPLDFANAQEILKATPWAE